MLPAGYVHEDKLVGNLPEILKRILTAKTSGVHTSYEIFDRDLNTYLTANNLESFVKSVEANNRSVNLYVFFNYMPERGPSKEKTEPGQATPEVNVRPFGTERVLRITKKKQGIHFLWRNEEGTDKNAAPGWSTLRDLLGLYLRPL